MNELTDEQKALSYYKAGAMQGRGNSQWPRPPYVPKRIRLLRDVRSDIPFRSNRLFGQAGQVYDNCESNQYGAVSININGEWLGVRLNEFEVLEWQENAAAKGEQHDNS